MHLIPNDGTKSSILLTSVTHCSKGVSKTLTLCHIFFQNLLLVAKRSFCLGSHEVQPQTRLGHIPGHFERQTVEFLLGYIRKNHTCLVFTASASSSQVRFRSSSSIPTLRTAFL